MLTKPVDQVAASDPPGRKIEHEALLVVYGGVDLGAIENEEGLHGGVSDAFIAIDKGISLDIPDAPPVAWRRRRCKSTTSPRVR
jgi:hypothetical protein